jgi:uncharacterized membrane protein
MTSNVAVKTGFDSFFGALMAMGMAGLGFGIYDQNIISGAFGIICIFLAILVNYFRNEWNDEKRTNQVEEKIEGALDVVSARVSSLEGLNHKPNVIRLKKNK